VNPGPIEMNQPQNLAVGSNNVLRHKTSLLEQIANRSDVGSSSVDGAFQNNNRFDDILNSNASDVCILILIFCIYILYLIINTSIKSNNYLKYLN